MILIRADANPVIGMGHIMRCLSIADAAVALGNEVKFLLADENVSTLVEERGYQCIVLNSIYSDMDSEIWPEINPDMVVVDSYYVTEKYLEKLRKKYKVVYIDDIAAFPYDVNILVNYNAYGSYIDYHQLYLNSQLEEPQQILGPGYAPLRSMFKDLKKRNQKKNVENVLISTGGSDPDHFALEIVKAKPKNYVYHILVGSMNLDKAEIRRHALDNIVIHENVSDMAGLISKMDIAVSAAGSTLYEICACGVPLITYVLADNQIKGADAFEKLGLAVNLGDMRTVKDPCERIISAVEELADDYQKRVDTGIQMQNMIDGHGAERMVREMMRVSM